MDIQPPKRIAVPRSQAPIGPRPAAPHRPGALRPHAPATHTGAAPQQSPARPTAFRPPPVSEPSPAQPPSPIAPPASRPEAMPLSTMENTAQHVTRPDAHAQPEPEAVRAAAPQSKPVKPKRSKKRKSKKRGFVVVTAVMLALAAIGTAAYFIVYLPLRAPAHISGQFVEDIQNNDPKSAYGLTSQAFRDATSESDLAKIFTQVSANLQGKTSIADQKTTKVGAQDQVIIVYTVGTADGNKYIRIVLRESQKWQIMNFRSSDTVLTTQEVN